MPVIGIPIEMLEQRIGVKLSRDQLVENLLHLGCDVEGFATLTRFKCARCGHITEITATQNPPVECPGCGLDFKEEQSSLMAAGEIEVIRMELLAVRPDIFDPGGLARTLRAYLGKAPGLKAYPLESPSVALRVDPSTQTARCPRPAIAAAVVRNLNLDDDLVKAIMKLQENLHWALGRDRKHASIGVYDLDTVCEPMTYRGVNPDEMSFVPLGYRVDDPNDRLTPQQILDMHPKGKAFAHLLAGFEQYPLLEDKNQNVLSMPPIINSEATRVRQDTNAFFIDVTGTNTHIVNKTLAVLVTSLIELQPDITVEQVTVEYPDQKTKTPDLTPQHMTLDAGATARLLGIELKRENVTTLLEKMGHAVEARPSGPLEVSIPAYRSDILHSHDLMEDVAIAYGYHNITPTLVPTMTVGRPHPMQQTADLVRQTLVGLGYWEVMTLNMTSPKKAFDDMHLESDPRSVILENPISTEQTQLRVSLLPGLLETLGANTHRELPQKLFEVGPISVLDETGETGAVERLQAAAVLIDARAGSAEARALVQAFVHELDIDATIQNTSRGNYLEGRCGQIRVGGTVCGHLGEIHPVVLENFGLAHPVIAFEIDLLAADVVEQRD